MGDDVLARGDGRPDGGPGVGDRLPPLTLRRVQDGARVAWRAPERGAPVVVFLAEPAAGREYLGRLARAEEEFRAWSGRPLVVLPEGAAPDAYVPPGVTETLTVLRDEDGEAHRRCGVGEGTAAVLVADRWGQIYHVERADSESRLPGPDALADWFRYLSTQCPECGVPDEPGRGEWEV